MMVPSPNPMLPVPCRILRRQAETRDVFTLELESHGLDRPFEPGQFNMLYVFGVGEVPISVSGDPKKTDKLVHTIREVGAVTQALAGANKGSMVGVRGPYGKPWPLDAARGKNVVIVAGGIGLAPLRPLLYAIAAKRRDFGNVSLCYGSRSPEELLFEQELDRWKQRSGINVRVTVDRAPESWSGRVGVVTHLIPGVVDTPRETVAFLCGPEVMMRFAARELQRCGLSDDAIMVSLERNMKCAVGFCGHCQFGPKFICKEGPVFPYSEVRRLMEIHEI